MFTHAAGEVINNVEIKNNNRITKETIITFGGIELGKDYSKEQLNKIVKKYFIFFWILHLKFLFSILQTHLIFQFELNFLAFDA